MNKYKKHIYPEELEFEICKSGYIPRLMKNGERLKVFHKYCLYTQRIINHFSLFVYIFGN